MKFVLQDVVDAVAKATKLARPDAKVVVRKLVSSIQEALAEGQRIEIRDFGVFQTKMVSGKKGRDLARNLPISLPAYPKVSFKAGKNLKGIFRTLPPEKGPVVSKDGQLEMPLAVNE
ncbi:MAG TPA: HU family DNA-binding protein [bacterium]|nr:HU family DNA-binding protein [bacterium]